MTHGGGTDPRPAAFQPGVTRRLEQTVALITGASSGIGQATALALADQGAAVALVARRGDRLDQVTEQVRARGGSATPIVADVTDERQAAAAVEQAVDELGRLDTVVANAGTMLLGPIVGAPIEQWQRMVEINLLGLMYTAHAAVPHLLKAASSGSREVADLVNVSSVAGRVVRLGSGAYNATKHGVGAFSESLRQEVTARHVRVSLIEPGAVATELISHNNAEVQERHRQRFAGAKIMDAEDIAEAIVFIVTRPRHMAINEMLIRPTQQEN
jgi:NADP-dependent 3-hydroxy acid dehydrogenase YdfG